MPVYVDPLSDWGWKYGRSCHLVTDGDVEELHEFATRIGLRRSWFQPANGRPHYDLTGPQGGRTQPWRAHATVEAAIATLVAAGRSFFGQSANPPSREKPHLRSMQAAIDVLESMGVLPVQAREVPAEKRKRKAGEA